MAHDKVYGVCENKCLVPVAPKTETDAFDSRIKALEAGEFESVTADVGNFGKITTSQTLSYSGYYDLVVDSPSGGTVIDIVKYIPVFMTGIPISGKVSLKYNSQYPSTVSLKVVSPSSGLTTTPITKTQTEYTVSNAINIYISCVSRSGNDPVTITMGIPVLV